MRIFPWAASLAAMWLFVFACGEGTSPSTTGAGSSTSSSSAGSSGSGTAGDAARATIDTFCSTLAVDFCGAYLPCCEPRPLWLPGGRDVDDATALKGCASSVFDVWDGTPCDFGARQRIAENLRNGVTVFDQAQFDICLDLLKSIPASGAACVEPPLHALYTACTSVFRGQIALGDACPYPEDPGGWIALESATVCMGGRCEYGKCVPFLKPGEACDLSTDQQILYSNPASTLCNFLNNEVCWGDPGAGGAGGGGGAGGAAIMGTCRRQGALGDACDPGNVHECRSYQCDATGTCVLPAPGPNACQNF